MSATTPPSSAEAARRRRVRANLAAVLGVLLVLVAGVVLLDRSAGTARVDAPVIGASDHGLVLGDAGAPHGVVVYEDFLCPFCGQLEAATAARLSALAADGSIRLEYRPFVLLSRAGDYSARATNAFAVVLDAAGPQVAHRFHDLLYADQPDEGGPFPDDDWLVAKAVEAGASEDAVRPGIEGMAQRSFVDGATREAREAGVAATPTVLVDGAQVTAPDVQQLADRVLAAVG